MNKFVKKSMAGLLAGVMALSSLAVGATAFAKTPEGAVAVAQDQVVSFTKAKAEDKVQVYSFKPAHTGYYAVSFTSDAYLKNKDTAERADYAKLRAEAYDKDGDFSSTTFSSLYSHEDYMGTVVEAYKKDGSFVPEKSSSKYAYVDGYLTTKLDSQYTYYFTATLYDYTNEKSEKVYTKANLKISRTDYSVYGPDYRDADPEIKQDGDVTITTNVKIPNYTVTYRGDGTEVTIPDQINGVNVESVDGSDNDRLTSLTLGKNVKYVGDFSNQYKLATLNLNDGLETIGSAAFEDDIALTGELNLPKTVKAVESYAFYGCGYTSARINDANTEIGSRALGFHDVLNDATPNPFDTKAAPIDGFYLIAPGASQATYYTKLSGITAYDPANCTHLLTTQTSKAATYFAAGYTSGICSVCGAVVTQTVDKKLPVIKSAKSAKKGELTVITEALEKKVTGYEIQVSTSKKFTKKTTKTVKVKTNAKKALNKTITGLKAGKKYFVRVRVYKGKKKGAFTAAKAVKVK